MNISKITTYEDVPNPAFIYFLVNIIDYHEATINVVLYIVLLS